MVSSMMSKQSSSFGFNLFTHQEKRKKMGEGALVFDYANLREAILELFLSVKIRSDEEIDQYDNEKFEKEKLTLANVDGY